MTAQEMKNEIAELRHRVKERDNEIQEQADTLVKADTRIEELELELGAVRDQHEEDLDNTPQRIHEVLREFAGIDLIEPWATTSTEWRHDLERAIG